MLGPGESAPSVILLQLDGGDELHLEGDGPHVLAFLEADCPTCRLTVPYLSRLAEALGADKGRLLLVSQDGSDETQALVDSYRVTFPVVLDVDLNASTAFDPPSVPAFFLVEADGTIGRAHVGFHKEELNTTASDLMSSLGLDAQTIARLDDGAPFSKPGCVSRHIEQVVDTGDVGYEPIDLRPERGKRASHIIIEDDVDPYEYCMSEGFSPFVPVVPPTVGRVEGFLEKVGEDPGRIIGFVPPCYGRATVEKIAANAIMAGCKPEYMPVLIPVVRAACDERFNLHGVQATTNSATPMILVSGNVSNSLGFASGAGVFGNVSRANSSIGRALQLIMTNLGGARPNEIDMATLGNPGRFSYCIAENHQHSPWEPLHVELNFDVRDSTVTLFAATGMMEVSEHTARTGANLLRTIAATLSMIWSWRRCLRVDALVVVCPEHAATLAADGFTKADVRDFLFDHTGVPLRAFNHEGTEGTQLEAQYEKILIDGEPHYRKFADPSQIRIIVAGGTAGKFSAVFGGWLTGAEGSQSVTYPIR